MEQRITAPKGCKIESVEHDDNSVIIMFSEDKSKFKKGDFLVSTYMYPYLFDYAIIIFDKEIPEYKGLCTALYNTQGPSLYGLVMKSFRPCTEKEKQKTLQYMRSNGVDWDEDNMEVIPYVWKPKEGEKYWCISDSLRVCFSYYNPEDKLCIKDIRDNNCFKTEELTLKYAEEFKRILKERKL